MTKRATGTLTVVAPSGVIRHRRTHRSVRLTCVLSDRKLQSDGLIDKAQGTAQNLIGGKAALYHLDSTKPGTPRARTLNEEIARVVRGRAAHPGWAAGMMRHGFRGGAEIAATLDHMAAFANLAAAVAPHLFDLYHDATLGSDEVRAFLQRENPDALAAMQAQFRALYHAGLWHTRRNSILASLGVDDAA